MRLLKASLTFQAILYLIITHLKAMIDFQSSGMQCAEVFIDLNIL